MELIVISNMVVGLVVEVFMCDNWFNIEKVIVGGIFLIG